MITSPLSFFLKGSKAAFCFCKYQLFNFIFVFLPLLVKKIKDSAAGTPKTDPCYCLKWSIFFPESNNTVRQRNLNFLALLETFPLKLPSIDLCIPSGNDSHQLDLEKKWKGTNYCKFITFLYGANVEHTYYINPFAPGNFAANFARVVQPKKFT